MRACCHQLDDGETAALCGKSGSTPMADCIFGRKPSAWDEGMGWNLMGHIVVSPERALGAAGLNAGVCGWSGIGGCFFQLDPSTGTGIIVTTRTMPEYYAPWKPQFRAMAFEAAKSF